MTRYDEELVTVRPLDEGTFSNLPETDPAKIREQMIRNLRAAISKLDSWRVGPYEFPPTHEEVMDLAAKWRRYADSLPPPPAASEPSE
jgi:hypothetical protein